MSDVEFWRLIAFIDTNALDHGDEEAAVRPLRLALTGKSETKLAAFEEALAQKLFAIDGETYARNAGEFGFGDDGFLYARLYVVAKCREFYEAVRSDPKKMPNSIDQWCEALMGTYKDAWSSLTGRMVSDWPFLPSVSYETASNGKLWPSH